MRLPLAGSLKGTALKKAIQLLTQMKNISKDAFNSKRHRLFDNEELRQKVLELFLEKQWSPEQISQRLKFENSQFQVSYNTIYRAIYDNSLKKPDTPRQRGLTLKLRHKGKTRHKGNAEENRGKFPVSHPLSERPKEADDRQTIGHFEADTVLGKIGSVCLVTVVDRASRFLFAKKVTKSTALQVNEAMIQLLKDFPEERLISIVPDRGAEFKSHEKVSKALNNVQFYFPPPHSPWLRGTNENTNGLIREYLPKKSEIGLFSDEQIDDFVFRLNTRPRKCLGWKSPFEVFFNSLLHLI